MDGFIIRLVDHGAMLALSHARCPLGQSSVKPLKQAERGTQETGAPIWSLHCQEEVQLLMATSPRGWKSWGWARATSPWRRRANKSSQDAEGAQGSAPDAAGWPSSCTGTRGRDLARRLGENLCAPRSLGLGVGVGGWSSKPPAMKTLRDYLVQPPHFADRVAGAQRGEGICSLSLGMSVTQASRAWFSVGHWTLTSDPGFPLGSSEKSK